jgi:hypothetical protein
MRKKKSSAPAIKTTLEIEQWPIDDLKPYPKNARVITESATALVAKSLKTYGFQQPIVVDTDGVIIVGHTRHRAAKSLGLTEVPVTVAKNLTPEEVDAYRLMDNKSNEQTSWDTDLLKEVLGDMTAVNDAAFVAEMTGFSEKEIEVFTGDLAEIPSLDVEDKPERKKKAKSKADGEKCTCPKCGYSFRPVIEEGTEEPEETEEETEEEDEEEDPVPKLKKAKKVVEPVTIITEDDEDDEDDEDPAPPNKKRK